MAEASSSTPVDREYSGGSRRRSRGTSLLENVVLFHLSALIVGISWWFGGQSNGARAALLVWGTLGIGLFIFALPKNEPRKAWLDLWPLVLFDLFVGVSCFNPTFQTILRDGESFLKLVDPPYRWLPSSARPSLTLRELWQFNGIVLSCYNACLVFSRRRLVRRTLFIVGANAVALAIFGTFQKLIHAKGLWFGLVPSPQTYFFSTFIYHNHWGAFTLLNTAACLALLFHSWRRSEHRDIWHSPVLAGAIATLLLAATVPLSASRSSTVLMSLFLFGALVHLLVRLIGQRRERHESAVLPVLGIVVATVIAAGAIFYLARAVIAQRAQLTTQQLAHIRTEDTLNSRLTLYRDTWRMGMEKPWFGWGLETYGDVFRIYNSQRTVEIVFGQPYYREAHSDWLQSIAETGFVGTGLIGLLILVPLARVNWRKVESTLPRYLLAGCGIVLLYAWLEFPFANPSVMIAFWAALHLAVRYAALDVRDQSPHNNS